MAEFWADRYHDEATCMRCRSSFEQSDLDRLLWCRGCRLRARARATRTGFKVSVVLALVLAAWIRWVVQPDLLVGAWIATVVGAFWISGKVAREIAYGVERHQNRPGIDAAQQPPRLD